jgi:hypothetical protein
MIEAGGLKVDELLQKMEATRIPAKNRFPETLYHDLKRVRPLDAEAMIASGGRGAELVRAASRFFPDDWTKRTDRLGRLETRYSNSRSWYKGYPDGAGAMQVRNFSAALHEYTHRMQQAMPELDDFFQDLHHSRTAGDPIKQLRDLIPRSGSGSHEVTREDKYAHPYQGRIYSGSRMTYLGKYGALEVMTMAFEDVLGGDPRRLDDLMKRDREMLNLVIGLLYHYVP